MEIPVNLVTRESLEPLRGLAALQNVRICGEHHSGGYKRVEVEEGALELLKELPAMKLLTVGRQTL